MAKLPGTFQGYPEFRRAAGVWLLLSFIGWMAVIGMVTTGRWCARHAEAAIAALESGG
jgi:hypothetical protein